MPGNFVTVADRVCAWPYQVSFNASLPCGDGTVSYVAWIFLSIGPGHLLAQSVIRHQCLNNGRRRPVPGESLRTI